MIFFYGEGRLGNQILQYQALSRLTMPDETIVAVGLEDLHDMFDIHGSRVCLVTRSLFIKRLFKFFVVPVLLLPLAKWLRLFSYATEPVTGTAPHKGNSGKLAKRRGLFDAVTIVNGGYFQNPSLWKSVFPASEITIKTSIRRQVTQYLSDNVPALATAIFVHIRRGDYHNFRAYGLSDLMLPEAFYHRAVAAVRLKVVNPWFVFVTDDARWVERSFAELKEKCVVSTNARFDFALMTQCKGGILSNSTYSLCAALLMERPQFLIGPEYWFGFRVRKWFPPRIRIDHECVTYLDVGDAAT